MFSQAYVFFSIVYRYKQLQHNVKIFQTIVRQIFFLDSNWNITFLIHILISISIFLSLFYFSYFQFYPFFHVLCSMPQISLKLNIAEVPGNICYYQLPTLGVLPSLVSRWREVYSLWGTWGPKLVFSWVCPVGCLSKVLKYPRNSRLHATLILRG